MSIHVLDLQFQHHPHAIASYLVRSPAGHVLIETGPETTRPTLIKQLAAHGLTPADIHHILITHIHLDHAGCAGWWAQQGAKIYVHQAGAQHIIDPSRLLASAGRIYGDQMDKLWGQVVPAPQENVIPISDGQTIQISGMPFTAINTPGHAGHHHVFRLGDVAFAGDAAGVRLPGSNWISIPAPPPEFNLEVWLQTVDRLQHESFQAIYPTHFGLVADVPAHLAQLRTNLIAATDFIKEAIAAGHDRDGILQSYLQWNRERAAARGVSDVVFEQYEAANPLFMSVDGLMRYWHKKNQK